MKRLSRRQFLKMGALGSAGLLVSVGGYGSATAYIMSRPKPESPPVPHFQEPLPVPPVLKPVRTDATTDYYEIVQQEAPLEILPGLETNIWGYNGMFPGPTIEARSGRQVVIEQTNNLSGPTVVHLHGGVTPSDSDGFPTDMIDPGTSREYVYPNERRAATQWYHDHAMDQTGRNIFMSLLGLYVLTDEVEDNLPLPRDEYDVPLIITNRLFGKDGELVYDPDHYFGAVADTVLVNGAPWPRMEVANRKYRFRILNASNDDAYTLALSSNQSFTQIATDGGLMSAPVNVSSIPLAMAERVEVVIDFSVYPVGTQVVLQDSSGTGSQGEIMRFDVVRTERDDSAVPDKLGEVEQLSEGQAVRTREFSFGPSLTLLHVPPVYMTINGQGFDPDRVDAAPRYGDVEIWRLTNKSGAVHPVHIHLGDFQILDRNGAEPPLHETGWKDTVNLAPNDEVRVIKRFEGYKGRYLMHCHNLEHEDYMMMARFDVV